jgi:hypothetical protein
MSFEELQSEQQNSNVIFAAMIDEKPKVETILPPYKTRVYLKARSVPIRLLVKLVHRK